MPALTGRRLNGSEGAMTIRPAALTVDVEPDWGMRGTRAFREIAPKLLSFLEGWGFRATFFVVADLVDASGEVLAAIGERHEIGSHGLTHRRLGRLLSPVY